MGAIINVWLKAETIETLHKTLKLKEAKGVGIDLSINDEVNQYGHNVKGWVQQSQDEREAKKNRYFVANGKVKWVSEGGIKAAPKEQPQASAAESAGDDDLPF